MLEEWRFISGSDDAEVSSLGRIKRHGKIVRQYMDSEGYMRVTVGGTIGRDRVHRLVLTAFTVQPPGRTIANHRNGKKDDNKLTNLEWSTPRENSMYAALRGEWSTGNIKRRIKAISVLDGHETIYESQKEAASALGIHDSEVNKMLKGKRKTCHGYVFQYMDPVPYKRKGTCFPGQMSFQW